MSETLQTNALPLKRPITDAANLSWITVILTAGASLAGILFPTAVYATPALQQSSLTNDIVTLTVGLPVLIGSIWFARRGSWLGMLLWPGALLYVFYNYVAYAFGNPFGWLTLISLAIVVTSTLAIIRHAGSIDAETIKAAIAARTPRKSVGVVMILFGIFFILRVAGIVAGAVTEQAMLPLSEIGLAVADVSLSIILIAAGILLLRRDAFGYTIGLGVLFSASTLFIGLLIYFILEPFVSDVAFAWVDFLVVFFMSMICFVPFGLYVRAILLSTVK